MVAKTRKFNLHDGKSGSAITVCVNPQTRRNEVAAILEDGTVKINLNTPNKDDEINAGLLQFLSGILGVKENELEIVAGSTGKEKLIAILNLDKAIVQDKISSQLK